MSKIASRTRGKSGGRQSGKNGAQHRNRDKLGPNSGPMGAEDQRKDKYGSRHNQDANGLLSDETAAVRKEMTAVREGLKKRKRKRVGSR
jgi:hypothetical protein